MNEYEEYQRNFDEAFGKCAMEYHKFMGEAIASMLEQNVPIEELRKFFIRHDITVKKTRLENHKENTEDFEVNFRGVVKTFSIPSRFSKIKEQLVKGDRHEIE